MKSLSAMHPAMTPASVHDALEKLSWILKHGWNKHPGNGGVWRRQCWNSLASMRVARNNRR